ncbi:polymorphic toxin-type HINT domain-containing protein [Streptomyces sp. NPDC005799]|uniref:polymorphic toxin-type HINT domain-containing protein n=1 Tax=Streptomyces sp. NPDC005799 TaxID=3154678 RepID=UPI00341160D4
MLATDPDTGDSGPHTVTALVKGSGDKHLTDITLEADGPTGSKTSTLTAADGHPFWVPELHRWISAGELTAGQWLQTSAGTWVQITALRRHTEHTTVYNLTVDRLHTYYVMAGTTSVLVHNCGVDPAAINPDFTPGAIRNADGTWTIPEDSPLYRPPGTDRVGRDASRAASKSMRRVPRPLRARRPRPSHVSLTSCPTCTCPGTSPEGADT